MILACSHKNEFGRLTCALAALLLIFAVLPFAAAQAAEELIVATKEAPPFAMKQDGQWTGIAIDLWGHIGETLGVHTTFREYQTVAEMLQAVSDGSANAAIAAITVTSEREKTVDFTQPFFQSGLGIAVPANKDIEWLSILRNIFTLRFFEAVGVLITVAAIVGTLIWFLERRDTQHFSEGAKGLGTGLCWSASAMTQAAAADKAPATLWGRLVGMLWMIASIVIVASFTAGITSQLAAQRLQSTIRASGDLAIMRTGSVAGTSPFETLKAMHVDVRSFADVNAGLEALNRGKLDAFVYDRPILAWSVRKRFADNVKVLDKSFSPEFYAIALPQGSPLRHRIDLAMVDELRGSWWKDLLNRYIGGD
jgi:polar amino acid transport system substrate-binding protein